MRAHRSSPLALVIPFLVIATTSHADTLTFQQGDGGSYSSTQGAIVYEIGGGGDGSGPLLVVDSFVTLASPVSLLGFPDIIGANPGQIPPNATIQHAALQLFRVNASERDMYLHRVLVAWDENTVTGINWDDQLGISFYPAIAATFSAGVIGYYEVDITSLVQEWVSGTANYGVEMRAEDAGELAGQEFYSDDAPDLSTRPLLSVTFTAPVATEQSTWGKIKSLYR